jgi:hypothetical protein
MLVDSLIQLELVCRQGPSRCDLNPHRLRSRWALRICLPDPSGQIRSLFPQISGASHCLKSNRAFVFFKSTKAPSVPSVENISKVQRSCI